MSYADARHRRTREFYARNRATIFAEAAEWGVDPYAWRHEIGLELTPIELALWEEIRHEQAILYPQWPVGPFFVDFGNPVERVAIECDGKAWHLDAVKDASRQRRIESHGWTVYRIRGQDCFDGTEEIDDEFGEPVVIPGAARRLVREICKLHPIRRFLAPVGSTHACAALSDAFRHLTAAVA